MAGASTPKCYVVGHPTKCPPPGKSLYFKQVDGGLVFCFCMFLALVIFFAWVVPECRKGSKADA